MKANELISKMRSEGLNTAADILEKRVKSNQTSIIISDLDNEAYNSGLASFLMDHTFYRNLDPKTALQSFFTKV